MQPIKPKNWFQRNWKWLIPTGCLGMLFLVAAFIALIFFIIQGAIKSSDAYQDALSRAKTHAAVMQELGEPIEAGWWTNGSISVKNDTGRAEMTIPISGPKKSGAVHAFATKAGGRWNFSILEVRIDGTNTTINLLTTPK